MQRNPQLNEKGELQHLSIEGLPRAILLQILDTAESFVGVTEREVKKVPILRGKSVQPVFRAIDAHTAPRSKSPRSACRPT